MLETSTAPDVATAPANNEQKDCSMSYLTYDRPGYAYLTYTFLQNKYHEWYAKLVERARYRPVPTAYTEDHHIWPEGIGGTDTRENQVAFYPREHIVAHLCLIRMTEGEDRFKMVCAAKYMLECMTGKALDVKINSRTFAKLREAHAENMRVRMRG